MRRFFNRMTVLGLAAIVLAGCSQDKGKAKARASKASATSNTPAWNWDAYPATYRMRVATLPCQFLPKSTITMVSPLVGLLRVYVTAPQTNLSAGFLWAEFEPEIFAAEETALKDGARKLEDQEKLQWEIDYPRKKMQMEQQVEEAQRQASFVKVLASNTNLLMSPFSVGGNTNLMRPDALAKAEANLRLLKQSLAYLESTNYAAIGIDLAGLRTEWERRNLDFKKRRAQSRFEMPFEGKLTVSVPLSEGVVNYPVNTGQEIGVARDLSAVRVRVVVENAAWSGLPAEKLKAMVMSGNDLLEAQFAYQKIERVQNREEAAYYFEFPPGKAGSAARLIGANVSCDLWIELPEPVRIVPKLALILRQPEAFQNRNWSTALTTIFPGARLIIEGQTELGIVLPKEMKISSAK